MVEGLVAVAVAFIGWMVYGAVRHDRARRQLRKELDHVDAEEARRTRERTDADDRDGDAVERLRDAGRLRDGD